MKRVHALAGLGGTGVGGLLVGAPHVQADRLKVPAASLAELGVEALQGLGVLALGGPHHRSVPVVVGHHCEVAVALAVGDLVDADAQQPVEAGLVQLVGHDGYDDPGHRLPADA